MSSMDSEIDVPSFFLCPISLEIMKDPVTVSTGITYDRESIERWLFSRRSKNQTTCPVTKQLLSDSDLSPIPNHTLRRLIQAWCTVNASLGIERIPTPKPPISKSQIAKLLADAGKSPQSRLQSLRQLRSIAGESEANKRCLESSGVAEFLASLIENGNDESEEALSVLHNLNLSEAMLTSLIGKREGEIVAGLTRIMRRGSYDSRARSVAVLKSLFEVADSVRMTGVKTELFVELVQILKDQVSPQATKAALQLVVSLGPWGRNRIKAAEAGLVPVAVDLLLETGERRRCEMLLAALELACGCAEGRADLLRHGAGLAIVSKKVLRVSGAGSERAVRVLHAVAKYSGTGAVVQEMLQLGVVAKLCLVLQVDCGPKTKEKAREILKLHARTWRNSPCVPSHLLSSYPN